MKRSPCLTSGALVGAVLMGWPAPAPAQPTATPHPPLVAFLGDSLTAGFRIGPDLAYPALVLARLNRAGTRVSVVNAGVSGDTTAQGLARLDAVLAHRPSAVVVALGTNDALRGFDPVAVEANLDSIVTRSQTSGAGVLLLGMHFTTWLPAEAAARYEAIYPRVARRHGVPLVPFMLEGVAGDPALNLPDGLHPNAAGQRRVAEVVYPAVSALVLEVLDRH